MKSTNDEAVLEGLSKLSDGLALMAQGIDLLAIALKASPHDIVPSASQQAPPPAQMNEHSGFPD